jgi:hypothetical protein
MTDSIWLLRSCLGRPKRAPSGLRHGSVGPTSATHILPFSKTSTHDPCCCWLAAKACAPRSPTNPSVSRRDGPRRADPSISRAPFSCAPGLSGPNPPAPRRFIPPSRSRRIAPTDFSQEHFRLSPRERKKDFHAPRRFHRQVPFGRALPSAALLAIRSPGNDTLRCGSLNPPLGFPPAERTEVLRLSVHQAPPDDFLQHVTIRGHTREHWPSTPIDAEWCRPRRTRPAG